MDDFVCRQSEIRRKLNANGKVMSVPSAVAGGLLSKPKNPPATAGGTDVGDPGKNNAATVSDRGIRTYRCGRESRPAMETSATEISLPVSIPFIITAQKSVPIRLLIDISATIN